MRLITSMMTTEEMQDEYIKAAADILTSTIISPYETFKFKYEDTRFYETVIDLVDVSFSKNRIYDDMDKLILAYEKILQSIPYEVDFIAANDDTNTEVSKYEKDQNDIKDFGLFVTRRCIPNTKPYYTSKTCNAYLNFKWVSFGVIF